MGWIFGLIVLWAVADCYSRVRDSIRKSRAEHLAGAERKTGRRVTGGRRRAHAARHDAGWWGREVSHGFPVTRSAWHAAWLSHKAADVRGRTARLTARDQHLDDHLTHAQRTAEHRAHARQVAEQVKAIQDAADPPLPPARRALKDATGGAKVLAFPKRGQQPEAPGAVPAAPAPAPKAQSPAEPLSAPPPGTASTPPPVPPPGDPGSPLGAGGRRYTLIPPHEPPANGNGRRHSTVPSPARNGAPVATASTSEFTYDQHIKTATDVAAMAEQHHSDLQKMPVAQMADDASGTGLDAGNLGALADLAEAHKAAVDASRRVLDLATAYRDGLQRDHGSVNEAHQSAPGGGAERGFYIPS